MDYSIRFFEGPFYLLQGELYEGELGEDEEIGIRAEKEDEESLATEKLLVRDLKDYNVGKEGSPFIYRKRKWTKTIPGKAFPEIEDFYENKIDDETIAKISRQTRRIGKFANGALIGDVNVFFTERSEVPRMGEYTRRDIFDRISTDKERPDKGEQPEVCMMFPMQRIRVEEKSTLEKLSDKIKT